ncbi:MAG: TetR/AcrR family transcriptional regulator [Halanaerobiales bacterium]
MKRNMEENKKELIREAAVKVMAEKGFYNTKTSQIAKEAGVAVGTIYNYFGSKEEILEYIFEIEFEKRMKLLKKVNELEKDFWGKMKYFLQQHFQEIINNMDTGKILVREKEFPRKNASKAIDSYLYQIPEKLQFLLEKSVENNEIKPCNVEITAALIFGAIQGIVEKAIKNRDITLLKNADSEILKIFKEGLEI